MPISRVIPIFSQVSNSEACELARQLSVPYIETSAKMRMNIEEAFSELVRLVRKFQAYERSLAGSGSGDAADGSGGAGGKRRRKHSCAIL